jgi:hypothetical protein
MPKSPATVQFALDVASVALDINYRERYDTRFMVIARDSKMTNPLEVMQTAMKVNPWGVETLVVRSKTQGLARMDKIDITDEMLARFEHEGDFVPVIIIIDASEFGEEGLSVHTIKAVGRYLVDAIKTCDFDVEAGEFRPERKAGFEINYVITGEPKSS